MNNHQSQEVVDRFFRAFRHLENSGLIKSRRDFCVKYEINHTYFYRVEKNYASQMFQMNWLTILICDYGISAHWLLTGTGEMEFKSPPKSGKVTIKNVGEVVNKVMDIVGRG